MIRTTFRWLLVLLGLVAAAGAAAAWYLWVRSDEMVKDELRARLQEIAPACELQIGRVRFDWDRSVTVRDFAVRAKGKDAPPAFVVPEAVIRIDRDRFLNEQAVDVQVIKLIRPRLDLTRRPDGRWTVEDLMPFHLDPSIPVPEWEIEDATVRFRLEQDGGEPVVLTLQEADLRLVPSGRRQLLVRGLSDVADAGPLRVTGKIDLDGGAWSFSGSVSGLNTSGNIAGFALRSSASLRGQVVDLSRKLRQVEDAILADQEADPAVAPNATFRTASQTREAPPDGVENFPAGPASLAANTGPPAVSPSEPCDLSGLGLNAVVDLKFDLSRPDPDRPPDYRVWVECRDGQVVNTLLPFALRHLRGQLYWDNGGLRLTELRADGNGTSLKVDGAFRLDEPATGSVAVEVANLAVSDRYPGKLPPAVERFLQVVRPSGPIDLAGTFDRSEEGGWVVKAFKLTAKGASALPEPFPYLVTDINGVLEQTAPGRLEGRMTGKAGVRPVTLVAVIDNPGLEAEVGVEITAGSAVVDEGVREAFKPEIRAVLNTLGLEGIAENLHLNVYRPAGPGQKYRWWLTTRLRDGELEYERFPYRVAQLSGDLAYDSELETLTFRNVRGVHDRAVLTAEGSYRKAPLTPVPAAPGDRAGYGLGLTINAEQVGVGGDLRAALPAELKHVWEELRPGGALNLTAEIRWVPGSEPDIRLPRLDLVNGTLRPAAFPYALDTVSAHLRYAPGKVEILDFVGWHPDGTRVAAESGEFIFQPDGIWLLKLPTFEAGELRAENDLQAAAPAGLRHILQTLDLRGAEGRSPVEKLTGRIDVSGSRRTDAMTAGWDLTAYLVDASFSAGLRVSHATGTVKCEGQYGGPKDWVRGGLGLSQAEVLGQRLTRVFGPFVYENGEIVVGAREAAVGARSAGPEPPAVAPDRRMRAVCLGDGLLTLDAVSRPGEGDRYEGRVELSGGRLEYLASSRGGSRNVNGVMNGWVNFWGDGRDPARLQGVGHLAVSPAALYELPVIMQLFKSLTTLTPAGATDRTAFDFAQADFRIRNAAFEAFPSPEYPRHGVYLEGDAMRLIGGGRIQFDGQINLQFYTQPPRNPARVLPVVGAILDAATTGWLGFVVTGTTDNPNVQTRPLKALDDTWRTFWDQLGPLNPARTAGPPSRVRR